MRYRIRWAIVAALLLLLALPRLALAQGEFLITDPGGRLNASAIQEAAAPLLQRDAKVAVYVVDVGGEEDFDNRLRSDGLMNDDYLYRNNMIAIYVAFQPAPYSVIAYGDSWVRFLDRNDNAEIIRQDMLNPGLGSGDYTQGFTDALATIELVIIDPSRFEPSIWPFVGAGGAVAAAGGGAYAYSRRRRSQQARARLEEALHAARERVGALIADLGMRFRELEEKAKFDRVSYAAADVARITEMQGQARQAFVQVQERFKTIAEGLERSERPSAEQLEEATVGYDEARTQAEQVVEQVQAVAALRTKLTEEANQAREAIDRAKKA